MVSHHWRSRLAWARSLEVRSTVDDLQLSYGCFIAQRVLVFVSIIILLSTVFDLLRPSSPRCRWCWRAFCERVLEDGATGASLRWPAPALASEPTGARLARLKRDQNATKLLV